MEKMWGGRFSKPADKLAEEFNASIAFDQRMAVEDITGSIAHAHMLGAQGILSHEEADQIVRGLQDILSDAVAGRLTYSVADEDIHMNIERLLTERIGEVGKKLHTGRSRNDQVALDIRMVMKREITADIEALKSLISVLLDLAEQNTKTIMSAYTHLQKAQPTTLAHYLCAYCEMFLRDIARFTDCYKRTDVMPLGAGALCTTTYPLDREMVAEELGFSAVTQNSLDSVSDRDFLCEYLSCASICMMHLSRFCEEIILNATNEFHTLDLSDAYSTGSSIMPQKKNPDMAELIRGKTGRVYGALMSMLTILKGLPLAYNKDMQEDKETVFDACDTLLACIKIFEAMIKTAQWNTEALKQSAGRGFTNATDAADYLVKHGLAFRDAHHVIGEIVLYCEQHGLAIDELSLEQLRSFSPLFGEDVYAEISLETCVNNRKITGGPAQKTVEKYIRQTKQLLLSL